MITAHFFGCSFTAGDELSDDVYFPWKKDCANSAEYFARKNVLITADKNLQQRYVLDNYNKSYPSKIKELSNNSIQIHNHSRSGAGLSELVFKVIRLFDSNILQSGHCVYFQIPPYPREAYITNEDVDSLQLNGLENVESQTIINYKKSKISSHFIFQWAVEDLLHIILLKNFLESKKIKVYFIDLCEELKCRIEDIPQIHNYIVNLLKQEIELIDLSTTFVNSLHKLSGGHFNEDAHWIIANTLTKHILENN